MSVSERRDEENVASYKWSMTQPLERNPPPQKKKGNPAMRTNVGDLAGYDAKRNDLPRISNQTWGREQKLLTACG